MRFRTLTKDEKRQLKENKVELREEKLSTWHPWFAWKPVRLTSDEHEIRIFEKIYRKYSGHRRSVGDTPFSVRVWYYADSELDILKISNE